MDAQSVFLTIDMYLSQEYQNTLFSGGEILLLRGFLHELLLLFVSDIQFKIDLGPCTAPNASARGSAPLV